MKISSFLRIVDELTVTHIRLLSLIDEKEEEIAGFKSLMALWELANSLFSEAIGPEFLRLLITDLESRSLVDRGEIQDLTEYSPGQAGLLLESAFIQCLKITGMGKRFLKSIGKGLERIVASENIS